MYSFNSRVRFSEVDANGNLKWLSLIDYFQDCSAFHSENLNVGVEYLKSQNLAWILTYWHVVCDEMPKLADTIDVQTWPTEMKGFYGKRNFAMNDASGKRIAYANSLWVLMDTETGRPARIPDAIGTAYEYGEPIDMGNTSRKIPVPGEYKELEHFNVPSYYIDTNNHMNNSKYIAVALECLPAEAKVKELRVEYKKSAMLGDEIVPRITENEDLVTVVLASVEGNPYAVVEMKL